MRCVKRSDAAPRLGYKISFGRIPETLKNEASVVIGKIAARGF
jgi:hypothetical protein